MQENSRTFGFVNRDRGSSVASCVRLAGTSQERRRGLMGVTEFDEADGLWIVPCEAIHTFGMKMPIDSIFLDKHLRVKKLRSALRPGRMAICFSADSVLELPAGTIVKSGTAVGDQLERSQVQ